MWRRSCWTTTLLLLLLLLLSVLSWHRRDALAYCNQSPCSNRSHPDLWPPCGGRGLSRPAPTSIMDHVTDFIRLLLLFRFPSPACPISPPNLGTQTSSSMTRRRPPTDQLYAGFPYSDSSLASSRMRLSRPHNGERNIKRARVSSSATLRWISEVRICGGGRDLCRQAAQPKALAWILTKHKPSWRCRVGVEFQTLAPATSFGPQTVSTTCGLHVAVGGYR